MSKHSLYSCSHFQDMDALVLLNIFSNFISATYKVSSDHSLRERTSGSEVTLRGVGGKGVPKSAGRVEGRGRLERGP